MTAAELIDLAANRADAWNTLWQLHIAVSTALLALVTASGKPLSRLASVIICTAFLVFLWGNYTAFSDYHDVRNSIEQLLTKEQPAEHERALIVFNSGSENIVTIQEIRTLSEKIGPPTKDEFRLYYWMIGALVVLAILVIPYKRRCQESG